MHSDSCGLATTPVLAALHQLAISRYPDHRLLLGIDANTFSDRSYSHQPAGGGFGCLGSFSRSCPDVMDFRRTTSACPVNSAASFHAYFSNLGMGSCWGDEAYLTAWTTCMARTFLQVPPPTPLGGSSARRRGGVLRAPAYGAGRTMLPLCGRVWRNSLTPVVPHSRIPTPCVGFA